MDKWYVIVNPKAAGGLVAERWKDLEESMTGEGLQFDAVFTRHRFHAVELTISALRQGYRRLIAVGGDGTLHEMVNGIFMQNEVPACEVTVGVICAGTGNDWIRMHDVAGDSLHNIRTIVRGRTILQDIVKVTSQEAGVPVVRYMANIGGVGYDPNVCLTCNNLKDAGRRGRMVYIHSALKCLLGRKSRHTRVTVDGEEFFSGSMFSIAFGTGRYSGGGMLQTPDAVPDDGLLNVTVIKKLSKLKVIYLLPKLFSGRIYEYGVAEHTMGRVIRVETSVPDRVEVDGELTGLTPVTFEVMPAALRIITGNGK